MYNVTTHTSAYRLIGRNGDSYSYPNLDALARDLIAAGYYSHGGLYGLSGAIVERFATWQDPSTGRRYAEGAYVVEGPDGARVSREIIAEACLAERLARRRRSRASGRGWYRKPRRSKIVTQADRRHGMHARLDLAEIDPRLARIVGPDCDISDPYEASPRRTPQRSWKSHRAHQYR